MNSGDGRPDVERIVALANCLDCDAPERCAGRQPEKLEVCMTCCVRIGIVLLGDYIRSLEGRASGSN